MTKLQHQQKSALEQKDEVWREVCENNNVNFVNGTINSEISSDSLPSNLNREWPGYKKVMVDIKNADYAQVLECPLDILPSDSRIDTKKKSDKNFLYSFAKMKVATNENNVQQNLDTNESPSLFCKTLCPYGTVCQVEIELFPFPSDFVKQNQSPYTGLLTPASKLQNCIMRLSSAMKPPGEQVTSFLGKTFLKAAGDRLDTAKLFPCAAIKAFRGDGVHSGNLLFGGAKVGQIETDFFAHCLCTQMTERVSAPLKPFIRRFYNYSENPMSLGVSNFCTHDEFGNSSRLESQQHDETKIDVTNTSGIINFPYILTLYPVYQLPNRLRGLITENSTSNDTPKCHAFDKFIDDLVSIPSGSILYDIFACPDPLSSLDSTKIQRIGRIRTTSEMVESNPHDALFFKHQRKEEDFELRPEWRQQVKLECTPDGGKTIGTIDKLAGWRILEQNIQKKDYIDFEELAL